MEPRSSRPAWQAAAIALALALLYVALGKGGLMLDPVSGFATFVWPPTGLSLAALVTFGPRVWPGVAVGAFVVNVWVGAPPHVALGMATGNTLEALIGAWALRRRGFHPAIDRVPDALALVVLASLASTFVSATFGVGSLALSGRLPHGFAATWRAWWLGDVVGDLVFAPLLLTTFAQARTAPVRRGSAGRRVEAAALGATLVGAGALLFWTRVPGGTAPFREAYMVFPLLLWAAFRFGARGAARATFAASVIAIVGTARGAGPFVRERLSESLLFLQVFVAIAAATSLLVGAVLEERRSALALRDSLLSIASHELRTPLTAVQLRVQSIARATACGATSPERFARDLTILERNVLRLTRLVEELLDFSRIAAGRFRLDLEDVDLCALVRDVVDRWAEPERALVRVTAPGDPIEARTDRMRVEQVVTNLVSNAVKYGAGKPVDVTLGREADWAKLVVCDRGPGIAREDLQRIFERFERVGSSKGVAGFGLGLWIVKEVICALGGTIDVESEVGSGSTFVVRLPLRPVEEGPRG